MGREPGHGFGKVFVFLGSADHPDSGLSLKLRDSHAQALTVRGVRPTGYGLGRPGWVTVPLAPFPVPMSVLRDWVDESYRLVAPRTMVAELDGIGRR